MSIKATLLLFLIFICNPLYVLGFKVPELTGPVLDQTSTLDQGTIRQLSDQLYQLFKTRGVQIQVFIPNSLQDEPIENVAIQVFDKWKLGDEKTDKGLLFIIAPNEKRMRIEVGQGLEGDIPDVIAKRIIADVVKPFFQRGEFKMGILQGVNTIISYIETPDETTAQLNTLEENNSKQTRKPSIGGGLTVFIIIGIWLIIFMLNPTLALYILFSFFRGGGGGGWSGGGGGWSGRGGKSSGGGASGGW